ncbi:hypothetical protein BRC64_12495 [Halobacteriales archaeon QH_10_67_22]|nr:MAG: hypothetical protein BRC64_12495 [Halobacteriales archaeon QH_10_67_22]
MTESSSTNARLWVERDGDGAFAAAVVTDGTVRLATGSLVSVVPGGRRPATPCTSAWRQSTSVPTAAGPTSNSIAALTVAPVQSCGRSGRTHPPFGTGRH